MQHVDQWITIAAAAAAAECILMLNVSVWFSVADTVHDRCYKSKTDVF